jgi:hypothetical protein
VFVFEYGSAKGEMVGEGVEEAVRWAWELLCLAEGTNFGRYETDGGKRRRNRVGEDGKR